MPLIVGQVVRVRVAVVIDTADASVGQVFDEDTGQWTDLVWIDLAGSTAFPMEFGDAEFWAEVSTLTLTRLTITRPAVRLRAWRSGGMKADEYEVLTSGSATINQAKLLRAGADLTTNLPGLGAVLNKVRVRGFRDQRIGWSGRVPAALAWERTTLALRKRVKYGADSTYEQEYLTGVSGFAANLGALNGWLSGNLPEYAAPITVGATLEFSRLQAQVAWTYRYKYVAVFTLHAALAFDASSWTWTVRGALLRTQSFEVTGQVCGGATPLLFYGDAYQANTANIASIGAGTHINGTLSGAFATPAAGGGTVTASPRGAIYSGGPTYGVDITLTVTPKGRISNVAIAGVSSDGTVESVTAWGACKAEGGLLA